MGFITTKVKADGRFFLASIDLGEDGKGFRDAHPPLEGNKTYWGHLFTDSLVGQTQYVEYSEVEAATFKGDELEELPGEFRLVGVRGTRKKAGT
jgi:hypothetical protein